MRRTRYARIRARNRTDCFLPLLLHTAESVEATHADDCAAGGCTAAGGNGRVRPVAHIVFYCALASSHQREAAG